VGVDVGVDVGVGADIDVVCRGLVTESWGGWGVVWDEEERGVVSDWGFSSFAVKDDEFKNNSSSAGHSSSLIQGSTTSSNLKKEKPVCCGCAEKRKGRESKVLRERKK
jgi:hypothetical protein